MSYPSTATIKRLFAISGNLCAFPKCKQTLVDQDSGKVIGEICHIKAQNKGGPRYDSEQKDKERHSFDNLILMCPVHHQIIDADTEKYSVEALFKIKDDHHNKTTKTDEPSNEIVETLINKILASIAPQQKNIEYFKQLIKTGHWEQTFISRKEFWICEEDNLCQIEVGESENDFHEPWTKVYPDQNGSWRVPVYLKINNVAIKELTFISCDGGRIFVPMPKIKMKDKERVFYWDKESLEFDLSKILGKYYIYENIFGVAKISKIEIV